MTSDYIHNEKDIETVVKNLKIFDPKNANREYAIQLIESFQIFGNELARTDEALAEYIREYTKKKD